MDSLSTVRGVGHRARVEVAGGFHHVTARGNRRNTLFHDERDYLTLLRHLETAVERFRWLCHGFCLLPNHCHLLVETPEPNLGRGMLVVNGSYARYVNWRYKLDGHAFQGPYHDEHVTHDGHLLTTCRYITRNPVEAGLCDGPEAWKWPATGRRSVSIPARRISASTPSGMSLAPPRTSPKAATRLQSNLVASDAVIAYNP
jgi:REP element-mobilizing transposase RayT